MNILYKTFPAFSQPYFRYFWLSQWFALIGLWMQLTAQQWLVYTMTGSAFLLGLLGVAQFGPIMLFSLFAGVIVDRIPKRNLLRCTQTAYMLQAFTLAILVFTHTVNYYNVLALAFLYGCIQTLDTPARQSFIPDLVPQEYLRSAISMNSANFNVARMIGPALGALLMAKYGAGWLFLLNGISMLPVIYVYWRLPIAGYPSPSLSKGNFLADIAEGLSYAKKNFPVCTTLIALAIISTFIMNYNVFSPVYADRVLHRGVTGFGMITAAIGVGAFAAALWSASRSQGRPSPQIIFGSGIAALLILIGLAFMENYYLALLAFVFFGLSNLLFIISINTTIQMNTDVAHRGRILSIYSLVFLGATPLGNLISGSLIQNFGIFYGLLLCALLALVFFLPLLYKVYLVLRQDPERFIVRI